ncbi:DUF3310 domain-containing protein [Rhodococcus hoagii]|nr:DUF3310 domain-containing protein [Prescottella equi]MBM4644269.1 DUF3310 domain-containing protein [Prescottella equi]
MSDNAADPVNHPGHYTSHPSGVECIQVTEHMSFCLGNAIKYIWRADLKGNAIEDLQKARWYVDREIARLGGEPADLDRLAADGRLLPEGGTDLLPCDRCNGSGSEPAVCVPDSGPDGTPEKPWPTWQDVPEGVKYRSSDGCYCFVNRNGSRFPAARASESTIRSSFSDVVMGTLAPFVRVDGDKE